MNCEQVYTVVEGALILIACLASVTLTAAWCIIVLTNVVKWAVPVWLPTEEEIQEEIEATTPPPQLNAIQEHYRQACNNLGRGVHVLSREEVDDGD